MTGAVAQASPCYLYYLYDVVGRLVYIGMTDDLEARYRQHAGTKEWWPEVHHRWVVSYPSRATCTAGEALAIHALRPPYNVMVPDGARCATLAHRADSQRHAEVDLVAEIDAQRARADDAERRVRQLEQPAGRGKQRVARRDLVIRELTNEMRRGHTELHHLIREMGWLLPAADGGKVEVLHEGLRQIRRRSWEVVRGQSLSALRPLKIRSWTQELPLGSRSVSDDDVFDVATAPGGRQ